MAENLPALSIGRLAAETGCKVETIRYYERIGLLAPPPRSQGGHRHYDAGALGRLNFIRRARGLGFRIEAVRALLDLADGKERTCAGAERLATAHLGDVRAKLADLRALEQVLADMVARCRGGTLPECPLIEALYASATGPTDGDHHGE